MLSVRIGIATGQVLIGETIGEGESAQVDVVGETPNLAARLQAEAGPNGIVISAGTHRLTEGLFDCASLGKLHLKGFAEPVVAWQVHGTSMAESRFDAMHSRALTPMVGRDRELGLLMDCWERVGAGEAQVALLSGEAGVGKSRMLNALRAMLNSSGPYMLTLYCSPYHQASALHPVINHYERFAGIVPDDSHAQKLAKLETLLAQTGATLEETVPIAATLLSIPFGDRYAKLKLTPEQLKESVSRTMSPKPCLHTGHPALPAPTTFMSTRTRRPRRWRSGRCGSRPSSTRCLPRPPRSSSSGRGGDDGPADRGAWPPVRWRRVVRLSCRLPTRPAVGLACGLR